MRYVNCHKGLQNRGAQNALYDLSATTLAPTQSSMASDMKVWSKTINLIVLRLDSWPQAGGSDTDREGVYQIWKKSLWLGHPGPRHLAQADQ